MLRLIMLHAPQEVGFQRDLAGFGVCFGKVAYVKLGDSLRGEFAGLVNGPGPLESQAWSEESYPPRTIERIAEVLYNGLLVRTDDNDAAHQIQSNGCKEDEGENRSLEQLVEPGLGDLEAELIVDGAGGAAENAAGLVDDAEQSAVKGAAAVLALQPGAIDIQDHIQGGLDAKNSQAYRQDKVEHFNNNE